MFCLWFSKQGAFCLFVYFAGCFASHLLNSNEASPFLSFFFCLIGELIDWQRITSIHFIRFLKSFVVLITNYPGSVLCFFGTSFAGYQETSNLTTSKMSYQTTENTFIWASSVMYWIFVVICWVTCLSFKRNWRGCTFCWTAHFFVSFSHWTALMAFWLGISTYSKYFWLRRHF